MEETLTSIKGFIYAISIDLNMGDLSIPLNNEAKKILTIIMQFGAYKCFTLPMGVMPAMDLFQARMAHLFTEMGDWCPFPYIDDVLHFKGSTFEEHMTILDEILKKIGQSGLQVSAEKSRFCQESVKYLVFKLHRMGYTPLPLWVSAILRINLPMNLKQIRAFLGMINFIKNISHDAPRFLNLSCG